MLLELAPKHEWRFEVGLKDKLLLKLVKGTAEIFGTELALGQEYEFSGQKAAVYSWYGCKLEYSGNVSEYTSDDTPMPVYANLHFALEELRSRPTPDTTPSTSILTLGPVSCGKSSVSKILLSYALKQGRTPLFVNLNPKCPAFTPPGGISASPVTDILDVENGWGYTAINGPSPLRPKQTLSYYFGLETIGENESYYRHVVGNLAAKVDARLAREAELRSSGMVIDAPTDLANAKTEYSLVEHIIQQFHVNVIAVIGDERLYSDLFRRYKEKLPNVTIVKLARSGGAVADDDSSLLRGLQHRAIQQYFYGIPRQILSPYTLTVRTSEITVYRILEQEAPVITEFSSGDTGDYIADAAPKQEFLTKVEPSSILQNCVMAMINSSPDDPPEAIVNSEVMGYVHVVEADDKKKNLQILIPLPGRLPNKPFIFGDFRYHE